MSITPASMSSIPFSASPTPESATQTNQAVLHNSISQDVFKDEIKLSEKALSLLTPQQPPST